MKRTAPLAALLIVSLAEAGCGKKGPPLPPLRRVPAGVADLAAQRFADVVFVRFTVPSANVEGPGPADLARMDVYAITTAVPLTIDQARHETVRKAATLVASERVRPPLPPPPPSEPGRPPPPPVPLEPGLEQGAPALVREVLSEAAQRPIELPRPDREAAGEKAPAAGAALLAPHAGSGPVRYYFAVGVTRGGRPGETSAPVAVPLAPTSSAPAAPALAYDEQAIMLRWTPSPDARIPLAEAAANGVLVSRPLLPPAPPTRYDVYEVRKNAPSGAREDLPAALNAEPLAVTEFRLPGLTFGAERCFAVRPVDTLGSAVVRGALSDPACVVPTDTFAPAAPRNLQAVAGAGGISLIWEANAERDLAGYMVLRGESPGERLSPLTETAIRETTLTDSTVKPGVRYVYAVVAVDNASPQNVSGQSNRVEETAR
jgi:hypothetical protein